MSNCILLLPFTWCIMAIQSFTHENSVHHWSVSARSPWKLTDHMPTLIRFKKHHKRAWSLGILGDASGPIQNHSTTWTQNDTATDFRFHRMWVTTLDLRLQPINFTLTGLSRCKLRHSIVDFFTHRHHLRVKNHAIHILSWTCCIQINVNKTAGVGLNKDRNHGFQRIKHCTLQNDHISCIYYNIQLFHIKAKYQQV